MKHTCDFELLSAFGQKGGGSVVIRDSLLGREVELRVGEDNASAMRDMETGFSPQLRHTLSKVHRVCLGSLNEMLTAGLFTMTFWPTMEQRAGVFTKGLTRTKHASALDALGIRGAKLKGCQAEGTSRPGIGRCLVSAIDNRSVFVVGLGAWQSVVRMEFYQNLWHDEIVCELQGYEPVKE
eukprot:1858185-Amphidinium_carterae.2